MADRQNNALEHAGCRQRVTAEELEEVLGSDDDIKGKKEKEFWRNLIKEADLNDDG